jgi:gamma-glutamyltranspeptidase/glutathione hydrolase
MDGMAPPHPCTRREFLWTGVGAAGACGYLGANDHLGILRGYASEAPRQRQAIACSRREAAEAARGILLQGGNAVDAAAAALMVQFVIEPHNVGFGGYGSSFVCFDARTGRVHAIDADARAPHKFDPATFKAATSQQGYLSIGVPGCVAGVDLALRKFGTLPFKVLAQPALALAEDGLLVTATLATKLAQLEKQMDPASRRAYFPRGVPAAGSTWTQPDLGRLIRRLGEEGPDSFYRGEVAATICRQVQAGGGVLAETDFRDFRASAVEPLHIHYRDFDLYTPPLPSGGLTSLSVLKTLEQFDLSRMAPWGAEYIELFAGASNLAWRERFQYFGDPDFVRVPVEDLLSEKRAAVRAEMMRRGRPSVTPRPSGASHTVNLVVADKYGNIVSWTATHGGNFGSHVAIEGLGLILGHGMSRFSLSPSDPNFPAPGKRPQHNMSPLVILRDGHAYAGLGLPGGRFIVSVTAQLANSLIDFKATAEQAVNAPRVHTEGSEPIQLTSKVAAEVVKSLRQRGHRVKQQAALGGPANIITVDQGGGRTQAAATRGSQGVLAF